jgi:DNA replicative helicase MCM subunit Mcm2 (Cdc46/Mcm family)
MYNKFNVMEHGEFPLNKHGKSKMISAATTIIGTSNPKNIDASWINSAKASKGEIPLRRALIDRFDIVLIFKDNDTEESANSYALEKIRLSKISSYNYRFLKEFLQYLKSTVTQVTFTKEAEIMVAKYYAGVKVNENLGMTNRAFETFTRICKAWARLHLKTIVDTDIVNQVQKYFSGIMLQYGQVIKAAIDPRELACEEIINVIKQLKSPISFEEAARQACQQNRQVEDYFGPNLKLRDNNKLHEVSERVREYDNNVKVVQIKPLVLEWIKDDDAKTTSNEGED